MKNVFFFNLSSCKKVSPIFYLVFYVKVINIFNLFITYGDTFLPTPTAYDDLYYEIIRVHHIFDNLYTMGMHSISSKNYCSIVR